MTPVKIAVSSLVACLLWTASVPAMASEASRTGSCEVACDRASAFCEQKAARSGKCPRKRQACYEKCSGAPKDFRNAKQKRLQLCTQRCDLSRHSCEEANPGNGQACAAGQAQCTKRCK